MTSSVRTPDDFRAWAERRARGLTYAGPDPHYGIGLEGHVADYGIACFDETPAAALLRAAGVEVWCPPDAPEADGDGGGEAGGEPRGAPALVALPPVRDWLRSRAARFGSPLPVLVFKPSYRLEQAGARDGWRPLAAPAALARRFENKAHFRALADALGIAQPPGRIVARDGMAYGPLAEAFGPRLVVQAPYGYAGMQTHLVADDAGLAAALAASRSPEWRVAGFVDGTPLSVNACVTARGVAVGAPFLQLTGLPDVTPFALGSCGQDWAIVPALGIDVDGVADLARRLGGALAAAGFRGVFGVDAVQDGAGRLLAIEVNARLVASIALYTQLELADGRLPLLARHVLAHLDPDADAAPLDAGAAPLAGGQVVAHHVGRAPFVVAAGVATGAWPLGAPPTGPAARVPAAVRPAVRVDALAPGEALVLMPAPGRTLATGAAFARLQFAGRGPAAADGTLVPDAAALLGAVARAAGAAAA